MLKSWAQYARLADRTDKTAPELISLSQENIWHLPAYAQTEYVYDGHAIIKVDEERYHHTPTIDRVNQFDAMGPSYGEHIKEITIEKRLGTITSAAAEIVANEEAIMWPDGSFTSGKLMVIDALRTVDATYLLGAANPLALENKLLALPGMSAHNKGMAVDLTLVFEDGDAWHDAEMLGHVDHPDMVTNHRNYLYNSSPHRGEARRVASNAELGEGHPLPNPPPEGEGIISVQKHNRLYLEQVMLRGAIQNNMVLAPLREEFWDFRFPEDGLDLWRVLESISRVADIASAFKICSENIEQIHALLRAGNKEKTYQTYELNADSFAAQCMTLFDAVEAREQLQNKLHTNPEALAGLEFVYHGNIGLVFDAMLPLELKQANPELNHLFEQAA